MNKKILFIVNGFGLGNASRIHALIQNFPVEYEITIAVHGRSLEYFQNLQNSKVRLIKLNELYHPQFQASWTLSFITIIKTLINFLCNCLIMSFHVLKKYDLIVIDSDYTAILWRYFISCPLVAINNAEWTSLINLKDFKLNPTTLVHYWFEKADAFFHYFFATKILYPWPLPITPKLHDKVTLCAPLVKGSCQIYPEITNTIHLLVIPSGAGIGIDLQQLNAYSKIEHVHFHILGYKDNDQPNRTYYGLLTDTDLLWKKCHGVISNAGWSTLCEIGHYHRHALIMPIAGHTEQMANCLLIANNPNIKIVDKLLFEDVHDLINRCGNKPLQYQVNLPRAQDTIFSLLDKQSAVFST